MTGLVWVWLSCATGGTSRNPPVAKLENRVRFSALIVLVASMGCRSGVYCVRFLDYIFSNAERRRAWDGYIRKVTRACGYTPTIIYRLTSTSTRLTRRRLSKS